MARLFFAISESGTFLRRARSSSSHSRQLKRWLSSMARHSSEAGSVARRPPWKSPSWNSTSARASSTAAARLLQLDQFRVLQEAVHAADRDVHQARQAVQAAEAEEIEFDEAHQRREGELEQAGAAAEPVQFLRGE